MINIVVGTKLINNSRNKNTSSKVKVFGRLNYESHLARAAKKAEEEEKLQ